MTAVIQHALVAFVLLSGLHQGMSDKTNSKLTRLQFGQLMGVLTNLTSQVTALTEKVDLLRDKQERKTTSCLDWLTMNRASGVRKVHVSGQPITVYCDQTTDGGGWIVFQRRKDAYVDFYRGWADYREGFGDLGGSFWLGLDKLHMVSTSQRYELRVDLQKWDGTKGHATYSGFYVEGVGHNFALHYDNFTGGNAGDSLSYHNGRPFTTKDMDNDIYSKNCAQIYRGAWWYGACHNVNLNGDYKTTSSAPLKDGINWDLFGKKNGDYSLKFSEMKIRPM